MTLRVLRGVYFLCFVCLLGSLFFRPISVQTDLWSLMGKQGSEMESLIAPFSNRIQILIESPTLLQAKQAGEQFQTALSPKDYAQIDFEITKKETQGLLDLFFAHRAGLLSSADRALLEKGKDKEVRLAAVESFFHPFSGRLFKASADPFGLLSHVIMGLFQNQGRLSLQDGVLTAQLEEKQYVFLSLQLQKGGLSEVLSAMERLHQALAKVQNDKAIFHVTGVPLHTYAAARASKMQMTVLSILSFGFIFGLTLLIFKSVRVFMPVFLGLSCGMAGAFALTLLCFDTPHVLVFVFGTSLIGLSVDYALHFLITYSADAHPLQRLLFPLTMAFLTTSLSLSVLLFSDISFLNQIAFFCIAGLFFVYGFVILWSEPLFHFLARPRLAPAVYRIPQIIQKLRFVPRKGLFFMLAIFWISGLWQLRFNDDIASLYRPEPALLQEEIQMAKVTGLSPKSAFFKIEGSTVEDILQKEEKIKQIASVSSALSDFVPSLQKQAQNARLIQHLYETQAEALTQALGSAKKLTAPQTPFLTPELPGLKKITAPFLFHNQKGPYSLVFLSKAPSSAPQLNGVTLLEPRRLLSQQMAAYRHQTSVLLAGAFCLLCFLLGGLYQKDFFLLLAPSIMTILTILALFGLFHLPLHFFHGLAFFLIIGFGLDYTLFRFHQNTPEKEIAVFLSMLTTFVGFGLLAFTHFELTRALGMVLGLGIFFSYFFSTLLISSAKHPRAK